MAGEMLCATVITHSVEPSGGDFAQSSVPMLPPAPARLSGTNCTPYALVSVSAAKRPMMSVGPPGGNGMITRTGLVGYCCALAVAQSADSAAAAIVASALVLVMAGLLGHRFRVANAGGPLC